MLNILALLSLILAVLSISNSKKPHYALVYMIGTFITASLILLLNNLLFTGIAYLIVYVGAILVLFLFVILLIDITITDVLDGEQTMSVKIISLFSFVSILYVISYYFTSSFNFINTNEIYSNLANADTSLISSTQIQALAIDLYSSSVNLTVAGLILLLAMVAVIILSKKTN
jgi:NADH-ubiquinone oxidoreductase chain 6